MLKSTNVINREVSIAQARLILSNVTFLLYISDGDEPFRPDGVVLSAALDDGLNEFLMGHEVDGGVPPFFWRGGDSVHIHGFLRRHSRLLGRRLLGGD